MAPALSLPDSMLRGLLIGITYVVVIYGLTGPLVKRLCLSTGPAGAGGSY